MTVEARRGTDAIRARWDAMAIASPHASRPLFELARQSTGGQPYVALIDDGERQPILVVGRLERRPMRIRAGYRTLFSLPARWLVIVDGGVVGAHTAADYAKVMRLLRASLRRGEADIVQLSKVDVAGALYRAAREHLPRYRRGLASAPQAHHRSDLSRGFDAFYRARSKRTRFRIRRRLGRLDGASEQSRLGDAAGHVTVRRIGPGDETAAVVPLLDGITAKSYQRGIGVGFVDDALHRGLVSWAVAGGPFRIWTLSIDAIPVAFVAGLVHGRTFFLFDTAFDPAVSEEEPGALLLTRVVQELADDPAVDTFDFGYGDALYKQQFGDVCWHEVDVLAFAPRPFALLLCGLNAAATAAVAAARRVLGSDRVARLRRRRRSELTAAGGGGGGGVG